MNVLSQRQAETHASSEFKVDKTLVLEGVAPSHLLPDCFLVAKLESDKILISPIANW